MQSVGLLRGRLCILYLYPYTVTPIGPGSRQQAYITETIIGHKFILLYRKKLLIIFSDFVKRFFLIKSYNYVYKEYIF